MLSEAANSLCVCECVRVTVCGSLLAADVGWNRFALCAFACTAFSPRWLVATVSVQSVESSLQPPPLAFYTSGLDRRRTQEREREREKATATGKLAVSVRSPAHRPVFPLAFRALALKSCRSHFPLARHAHLSRRARSRVMRTRTTDELLI